MRIFEKWRGFNGFGKASLPVKTACTLVLATAYVLKVGNITSRGVTASIVQAAARGSLA
ncbi:MAG: hypothetical protein ABSG78_18755 [Verrucomicrobiota bacterium]